MTDNGQIIGESDFKIIDESELKKMKTQGELKLDDNSDNDIDSKGGNLMDDLIKLGFLDYDNLSEEEKKIFDDMKDETRDDFYELD